MKYVEKGNDISKNDNATRILLVRHGQSVGNLDGKYVGHSESALTSLGSIQANACAEFLSDVKIDAIYSSSLNRAYNTALPHGKMRNLEVVKDENLREIYLGKWEDESLEVIMTKYKEEFFHGWKDNFGTFTPPDGESVLSLQERMYDEIEKIANCHIGKTVLIVSHAAAIRSFWGKISNIPPQSLAAETKFPANASVSTCYYLNGKFYPIEYSNNAFM